MNQDKYKIGVNSDRYGFETTRLSLFLEYSMSIMYSVIVILSTRFLSFTTIGQS